MKKALRYLFISGGSELVHGAGLGRFCPQWLGDRADLIAVGGDKSKEDSMWKDSTCEVFPSDLKKIVAAVIEVAVHIVMSTHIYEFCGHFYLQSDGGPIGLRSTAALAALIMKLWDVAWKQLLKKEMFEVLLYCRYVDDCRNFARPLKEGWRWIDGSFRFSVEWEEEDFLSGKTDLQRTTCELVKAMNSLVDFIQFEGEDASMFGNSRLPTLDLEVWVCEQSNQVRHAFFEKTTCPNRVVQKETALNRESIRSTLVQETVRRLKNCSVELPVVEKQLILSRFAQLSIHSCSRCC